MKTCPYCAEEIQDAAIKCRFCQSWLVDEVPVSADTPPAAAVTEPASAPAVSFEPEPAAEPEAVEEPAAEEPEAEPETAAEPTGAALPTVVAATTSEPAAATPATLPETTPAVATPAAAVEPPTPEPKVEFTHSGGRYLLGYTDAFFGIWDRQAPAAPMERFPRTDDGWRQVWQRYAGIETNWMDLRTGQRSP